MHNATFHISNNIKAFAASRLGAPELDSPGMKHGLPVLEIFKLKCGKRAVIATVDCEDGLQVMSQSEWAALDNDKQSIACTALITNLAEWLVFCRLAMATKDDMAVELLDERTQIPLLKVVENDYVEAAPWVTTRIRHGGFVIFGYGFWRKERDIDLEELMQRAKVRTASGRHANQRAAKAQLEKLAAAENEKLEEMRARGEDVASFKKLVRIARRRMRRLVKRGYTYEQRLTLSNLWFVDPRVGSQSLRLFQDSGGKQGWVKESLPNPCYVWLNMCWWQCKIMSTCERL